ncbi:hypothetical protein T281_14700 [Rhodomicrobium udaipurense JA643]|nr:hypothetical protein T281_14700 [Rhodomicrobium udaipurense JA643]
MFYTIARLPAGRKEVEMTEKPDHGLLEMTERAASWECVAAQRREPQGLSTADFDPAAYMDDLNDFDITDDQKEELLGILWSIMASFVRLGFDVKICEQIFDAAGILPSAESLRVEFSDAAKTSDEAKGTRREESHDGR